MRKLFIFLVSAIGVTVIVLGVLAWLMQPPHIATPNQTDRISSGVTLWNPGEAAVEDTTIVIENGEIAEIRATSADDPEPICAGCYVMPGLIDAHVHTPPKLAIGNQRLFSLLYLQYGITSVRDLGQLDNSLPELAQNIKDGRFPGPRIYRCGPALDGTPAAFQGAVSLEKAEDGTRKVAQLATEGVDCIKTYNTLPAEVFHAVSAEAAAHDLPLIGHVPHGVKLSEIHNFEIAHFTGIPYLENDPPEGFAYLSQDLIDMTEEDVAKIISVMKQNKLSILPTNANTLARLTVSSPERFPPTDGLKHLPAFWQQVWPGIVSHPETEAAIQADLLASPVGLEFIGKAHKAGIDILAGTDVIMPYVIPGESLHLQIALLAKAFQNDETALEAVTHINGRHIDIGKIGRIQIGANADMLLFKEDPRQNLATLRNWTIIIAAGRLYERAYIDAAVIKYDRHFNGTIYANVMGFIYSFISGNYDDNANNES